MAEVQITCKIYPKIKIKKTKPPPGLFAHYKRPSENILTEYS